MSSVRSPSHAGSWYTDSKRELNSQLDGWLSDVPSQGEGFAPPIKGCKAIIGPHAGYSYSGPTAAWAYKSIDVTGIKRVFLLGPSHHVYLDGCALSRCKSYGTPIGELPLDLPTIEELRQTGKFANMDLDTDEDEHSLEMHLPYIRKIFENEDITLIPILVGAISTQKEREFGALLAPYLAAPDVLFVISSDFCHWGTRFSYTFYYPTPLPCSSPARLSRSMAPSPSRPIHQSIYDLDHEAMDILTLPAPASSSASSAHSQFAAYLARTKNTICGRHPIGVLFGALESIEQGDDEGSKKAKVQWVKYARSSLCENVSDSSVSYASAYVVI